MNNGKTRNSSLVMMVLIGAIFLLVFVMIVIGRITISHYASVESDNDHDWQRVDFSRMDTTEFDVRDFRSISFIGSWEVDLEQGDDWHVELTYPRDLEDQIEVELRGDELSLNPGRRGAYNWGWGWWHNDNRRLSARITMPELTALNIAGASDMDLNGFDGKSLTITISGAANIDGDDGHYDSLHLTMSGAGDVDLRNMQFVDANVILSGAGNVELGMNGGVLSGNLSGFGNIEYSGNVRDERVNVSGFGKVHRRN